MNAEFFAKKFNEGLEYEEYVVTGTEEQQRRWKQVLDAASVNESQRGMIGGFAREMNLLVISGIWCGDCVQQVPLLRRIEEANAGKIRVRTVDRDAHKDLSSQFKINGGDRVPVVLFLSEEFELCSVFGDRTINRYRALAAKQLGASCPIGIAAPDKDELAGTLADWLAEVERVQLMLRLSPRLRQKHGD